MINRTTGNTASILTAVIALLITPVLSFIIVLQSPLNVFSVNRSSLVDSAVYQYVADIILQGGLPYEDVFDHKGPLLYLIDAMSLKIGGVLALVY